MEQYSGEDLCNMMGFSIIEKLVSLDEGDVDQAHFVLPDLT